MADVLTPQPGRQPWLPADGAELVDTWNFYEVPLTGILSLRGARHLVHCLAGAGRDVSVWLYAPVTTGDETRLRSLDA